MASQKIAMANRVGEMVVMTQSVETKELYLVMVLRGDLVWDVQPATTPEDALALHRQYMTMCQAFQPVIERVQQDQAHGRPIDKDQLVAELEHDYAMIVRAGKGHIH